MEINTFRHEFKIRPGIGIGNGLILFKEGYVWDSKTNKNIASFKTLDDALNLCIKGKLIKEYIDELKAEDLILEFDGGRGSSSFKTFKFGHERSGGGDIGIGDLPARINVKISNAEKNPRRALRAFAQLHALDERESAVTVDEQGFITKYVHGGKSSVRISGGKGDMIYHNHPGGGAFSDSDLLNIAKTPAKGIVASGKNGDYIIVKKNHFKANAFARAVKSAKLRGKDYDDAVNRWLKKNRDKYGYAYEFKKAKRA